MKPSIKIKLGDSADFRKLLLHILGWIIRTELDRLTVPPNTTPANLAEEKLLTKLRFWMKNDGFQDKNVPSLVAQRYATAVLSMFNHQDDEDIAYTLPENGAIVINVDESEPIITAKITESGWLYGLADIIGADLESPITTAE